MKISLKWLRELVAVEATHDEIARRLTGAGLEVEGLAPVGAEIAGVIVAEVRSTRRHPQADNLTLVTVSDGRHDTEVVCGARNVPAPGGRVVWARPGARLPGGRTLEPREIRGVLSPGMLCAEDELGVPGGGHEGILVVDEPALAAGADFGAWVSDWILEVNVTPNRPDALGHRGIARELLALFSDGGARWIAPPLPAVTTGGEVDGLARVRVEDPEGCPRYTARVLTGVRVGASRLGARLRLESLGVRAISDVVDATNLAMLEWGHPLHAFDLDVLAGATIVVRRARPGEVLVTLDGVERRLEPEDLLICDAERPVAVAGVMGGEASGVGPSTTRLLLESAYFDPGRIRRTAKRLGLHTEASHRFERGTDPNDGVAGGSARGAELLVEMTGGRQASGWIDVHPRPIAPVEIALRPERTTRLLGTRLDAAEQARLLTAIGLTARSDGAARIVCRVPTSRPDLTREVDLIEEIARLHGYDRIPATLPRISARPAPPRADVGERTRDALRGLGLSEAITFGFGAPARMAAPWGDGDRRARPLRIANPLGEELSVMRTSLLPNLLGTLQHNLAHGVSDVRLFEIGAAFLPATAASDLPDEPLLATMVLAGERDGWLKPGGALDFFDLKAIVEALLDHLGVRPVEFRRPGDGEAPWVHPGVGAVVAVGDAVVGALGEVHPDLRSRLGVEVPAFAAELQLGALATAVPARAFRELPRFPGSSRDVSFFIAADVPAARIAEVVAGASPLIEDLRVLDDYREEGRVPPGQKGMLWSIRYRARDHTVTDEEVGREHERVLAALRAAFPLTAR